VCNVDGADMLEATATELESAKAEASIKTSDLQALSAALSQAEEQHASAAAAAAAAEAASNEAITNLEVSPIDAQAPPRPLPASLLFPNIIFTLSQANLAETSSQLETASAHLAAATAAVASLTAAADEAQKELLAKSQQIAQLQMSLADAEEQLVSITAREARSTEAETRRCRFPPNSCISLCSAVV
jgi:hypothetical protein